MTFRPRLFVASILSLGFLVPGTARAASAIWNVNADGAWATGTNWDSAAAPGDVIGTVNADTATFGAIITAARIITVDAGRNLGSIDFAGNSSAYTLSGGSLVLSSGGTLQTSGAGTAHTDTISTPITLANADLAASGSYTLAGNSTTAARILSLTGSVTGSANVGNTTTLFLDGTNTGNNTINGAIGDGASGGHLALVKIGSGTWNLGGTNSFSGGITINSGELGLSVVSASSSQAGTGAITLGATSGTATATIRFNNSGMNLSNALTVAAGSTGVKTLTAAQSGVSGPNFNGAITLNDHLTVASTASTTNNQTFTLGGVSNLDLSTNTLTISVAPVGTSNTAAVTISKPIVGSGNIVVAASGSSTGARTVNLSGSNALTGTITVGGAASGTTRAITVNVSGDQSGSTAGWNIDTENGATTAASTVNFDAGSTVAIGAGRTITIGGTAGHFGARTLNANGTLTNGGTLLVRRSSTVNVGGAWTQNGAATLATQGGGIATLNVNAGASFTYTSATNFRLDTSTSLNTTTNIRVNGGTFITGTNFRNGQGTVTTNTSSNVVLNDGGTLRLAANVADLLTTAGATINVQVGNSGAGGILDTAGFSTAINVPLLDVAGQAGAFTKAGAGTLTLAGPGSYTGTTTVTGGTLLVSGSLSGTTALAVNGGALELGASDRVNDAATVLLAGGTLRTTGFSETVGALTLAATSTIDLGSGASILHFADSSAATWTGTLNITHWSGSAVDQIFFGATADGLGANLAAIQFIDPAGFAPGVYGAEILATGEVIAAIPEPSTPITLLGGLGFLLGWRRRRKI